ncbi:MAG: hypothetical protein IPJ34_22895 [Myxococcales bacterium]|nr:hypothetical protein [Myxococcales bacterium]
MNQSLLVSATLLVLVLAPLRVAASPCATGETNCPAPSDGPRSVAVETNVLWPFFPGGIFEMRVLVPVVRADRDFRGELVLGGYSDFASRVVRNDEYGKVGNLSAKLGWRQFLVSGLHVEVSANIGWRREQNRPPSGAQTFPATIDGFQTRLWFLAGYQHELSPRLYVNARAGLGVHVYRSDAYGGLEKRLVPGGDLNLGFRL